MNIWNRCQNYLPMCISFRSSGQLVINYKDAKISYNSQIDESITVGRGFFGFLPSYQAIPYLADKTESVMTTYSFRNPEDAFKRGLNSRETPRLLVPQNHATQRQERIDYLQRENAHRTIRYYKINSISSGRLYALVSYNRRSFWAILGIFVGSL